MVWTGGRDALPCALALFFTAGAGAVTATSSAWAHRVDLDTHPRMPLRRTLPILVLLVVFVLGVLRATLDGGGFGTGAGVGAALALGAGVGVVHAQRTRATSG